MSSSAGLTSRPAPTVSLVVPVFNEEAVLPLLLPRLRSTLDALAPGSDVWFVDDGSRDETAAILARAQEEDPRVHVLELSRNFGHAAAITAGLDQAGGQVVVLMDADLQDPPELVPRMVGLYREGYDVVHARRQARAGESFFKRASAWLFYRLLRSASEGETLVDVGEFRLMSREVVIVVRRLRERHRLMRGLVSWVGFTQTTIAFERPPRAGGETKFPVSRMLSLGLDALTSFSAAPLRLATVLGAVALLFGTGYAAYAIYVGYILRIGVPGWTSLVILNVLFSGVVLICLGLVGEYVGRIFEEVKGRPLYVIRRGPKPPPEDAPSGDAGRRPAGLG